MDELSCAGMIVPILTPFTQEEALDEAALRRLVKRLVDAGVHGIMPTGSSGEFWSADDAERARIIEVVLDEVGGRVSVLAGTCAICTRKTIAMAQRAEALNVDGLIILTPFYVTPQSGRVTRALQPDCRKRLAAGAPLQQPESNGGCCTGARDCRSPCRGRRDCRNQGVQRQLRAGSGDDRQHAERV